MASDSLSVPPEALLRHRDFVVGLARELVEDVPQARRTTRAAWIDKGEGEAALRASLELQHRVVQSVLGQREPYRTILLLRYYARLSVPRIAERRGDTETSVRAQLGRALEILRVELDTACEGGRAAWTSELLELSRKARARDLLVRSSLLAVAAVVLAVPTWLAWRSITREAALKTPPFPAFAVDPASGELASIEAVRASLATKSIPELIQVAVQTQRTLRDRLLEPSAELRESRAKLLAMPSTGFGRILRRGRFGPDDLNALGVPGAGAGFSFATGANAWGDEADLVLEGEHFLSLGEGPGVLDLGLLRLEDLPGTDSPAPAELDRAALRAWKVFWGVALDAQDRLRPPYRDSVRALQLGPAIAMPGHVYLVRGLRPERHDVLAAFEAIAEDEDGWTIAWRALKIAPIDAEPIAREDPYWWVPPAPDAYAELGVEPLLDVLEETQAVAEEALFRPSDEVHSRFRTLLSQPGIRLTRLLAGARYAAAVAKPGGGAGFSFAGEDHAGPRELDLFLEGTTYAPRRETEACGVLLDLGLRSLESVPTSRDDMPDDLSDRNREIWDILWTLKPVTTRGATRAVVRADSDRVAQFIPDETMAGHVGHTYLLRSIVAGDHDVIAAFSVAGRDEHGDWILWKSIRNSSLAGTTRR